VQDGVAVVSSRAEQGGKALVKNARAELVSDA
jgi:hypothetical protein